MIVRFFDVAVEKLNVCAGLLEDIRNIDGYGCLARAALAAGESYFHGVFSSSARRARIRSAAWVKPC